MPKHLITQYYNQLHALKRAGISNELAIKQPFDTLVKTMEIVREMEKTKEG